MTNASSFEFNSNQDTLKNMIDIWRVRQILLKLANEYKIRYFKKKVGIKILQGIRGVEGSERIAE